MTINSRVEGGKLMQNLAKINAEIRKHEGKFIELTIKRKYKRRSLKENNYYWGVIVPIWKELISEEWQQDLTIKEVHQVLKTECNYKEKINPITGEISKFPLPTRNMKTIEFEEYLEKCRRLAFDFFNVQIPLPNEQLTLDL